MSHEILATVLQALARSQPSLEKISTERIRKELISYAEISDGALAAAIDRNLSTVIAALLSGSAPDPSTLDPAALTAIERHSEGVPVEEIVRGFRISIADIHERFVELAFSLNLPPELILQGSRILWAVGDAFSTRIIETYHALNVDVALRDAQRNVGAMRALLRGIPQPTDPFCSALDPGRRYAVVRCDVPRGASTDIVREKLTDLGSAPNAPALIVTDADSCFGVVSQRPNGLPFTFPVGLGDFVELSDLPSSNRGARESLQLARYLHRRGVQSVLDLSWRLAATSRPDIWKYYYDVFAAPLNNEGEFGTEIASAVRCYLNCGRSINQTAEQLHVHVNTVRYRLRRYEDLTNADLNSPDDQMAVMWSLELGDPRAYFAYLRQL